MKNLSNDSKILNSLHLLDLGTRMDHLTLPHGHLSRSHVHEPFPFMYHVTNLSRNLIRDGQGRDQRRSLGDSDRYLSLLTERPNTVLSNRLKTRVTKIRLALLLMHKQTSRMTVRSSTQLARVRFFPRVSKPVLLQVLQPTKRFSTRLTVIIRFPSMSCDMSFQSTRFSESSTAKMTDKRSVPRMSSFMIDTVRIRGESSATVFTNVRFVSSVSPHMKHQTSILSESFTADVTEEPFEIRVLLLLASFVDSFMFFKFAFFFKTLVALGTAVGFRFYSLFLRTGTVLLVLVFKRFIVHGRTVFR